jgi:hypothetical protein
MNLAASILEGNHWRWHVPFLSPLGQEVLSALFLTPQAHGWRYRALALENHLWSPARAAFQAAAGRRPTHRGDYCRRSHQPFTGWCNLEIARMRDLTGDPGVIRSMATRSLGGLSTTTAACTR